MNACNAETENVRIYTRSGKIYEGALQLCNASIHVNGDFRLLRVLGTASKSSSTRT